MTDNERHAEALAYEALRMDETLNRPPEWEPVRAALVAGAAALREVDGLRADQKDWRKGVELIASAAGLDTLCCVHISDSVLQLRAERDAWEQTASAQVDDIKRFQAERDALKARLDAALAVGPREEDVRRVALVIRRNDVQTREDELAADRILAALDAPAPCPTPEHDWQDFGGASYYCLKCKQSYHPSWGEMPPCKAPCPTCHDDPRGIDERIGGEPTNGWVKCPDCGGAKEK